MRICGRKAKTAPDAADHAVDQEAAQRPFGHVRGDPSAGGRRGRLDPLHRRPRPDEDRLEHDQHDGGKDQRAPEAVRQHAVDAIGGGDPMVARLDHHAFEHAAGPGVAGGGFDRRHGTAGGGQPGPRRLDPPPPMAVRLGQQRPLQVAAHVQQQPPHQTPRQRPGGILLAHRRPIPLPVASLPPRTPPAAA